MEVQVGDKRPREVTSNSCADTEAKVTSPTAAVSSIPPSSAPSVLASLNSPEAFEQLHVHDVYNVIAPHFSSTRYKPWPRVKAFVDKCVEDNRVRTTNLSSSSSPLLAQSLYGSLLIDVGCGNGKNMCIHDLSTTYGVGCDRSIELMRAASLGARRTRKVELVKVEAAMKTAAEEATATVSSAAVSSPIISEGTNSEKQTSTNKGGKKTKLQVKVSTEVAVPEALQRGLEHVGSDAITTGFRSGMFDVVISIAVIHHFSTFERRLAAVKELLRLCVVGTGKVLIYVWAKEQAKDRGDGVDVFVPWALHQKFADRGQAQKVGSGTPSNADSNGVLQRYYHLFVKGELEHLCEAVNDPQNDHVGPNGGAELHPIGGGASLSISSNRAPLRCVIEESYYDQENWCVVLRRL